MMDVMTKAETVNLSDSLGSSRSQLPKKLRSPTDPDFQLELAQAGAVFQLLGVQSPDVTQNQSSALQALTDSLAKVSTQKSLDSSSNETQVQGESPTNGLKGKEVIDSPFGKLISDLKMGKAELQGEKGVSPVNLKQTTQKNAGATFAGLKPTNKEVNLDLLQGAAQDPSGMNSLEGILREMRGDGAQGAGKDGAQLVSKDGAQGVSKGDGGQLERAIDLKVLHSPSPQGNKGVLSLDGSSNSGFQENGLAFGEVAGMGNSFQGTNRVGQNSLHKNLSGGDFLNTLSMVRGDEEHPLRPNLGNSPFEGEGGMKEQLTPQFAGKEVGNGLKQKKVQAEEDSQITQKLNSALSSSTLGYLTPTDYPGTPVTKEITEVSGHVIPGAMSRDRFATNSLMNMSTEIRNLSLQGGGEIRVRLKPENLGELNLRVFTDGTRVGLQIQASDEKARKVIEESMSFLKESLTAQHLTLGHVDISVAGGPSNSNGTEAGNDHRHPNGHSGFQDTLGQNANQSKQEGRSDQWFRSETDSGLRGMTARPQLGGFGGQSPASYGRGSVGSGRIDVQA